jgi:hypothetical protein
MGQLMEASYIACQRECGLFIPLLPTTTVFHADTVQQAVEAT